MAKTPWTIYTWTPNDLWLIHKADAAVAAPSHHPAQQAATRYCYEYDP